MQTVKILGTIIGLSLILMFVAKFIPAFHKDMLGPDETVVNQFKETTSPQRSAGNFVTTDGSKLMLKGEVLPVIGVNDYALAYQSNETIERTFATLKKAGVTTIRFWLFGDGNRDGFQPHPGVYSEARFKQADYVLYTAAKYDIKLIPVLSNNWTDYGGRDQYLKWVGLTPTKNDARFYTDTRILALFENYVAHVFSRKNTYTNMTYVQDPTILGWEIMNEPRATDNTVMNEWLVEVATDIKAHDPNHLVIAGTEQAIGTFNDEGKSTELCASSAIDVCSVHLYLFFEEKPLFASYQAVEQFLKQQKSYAQSLNKPIILGEFGIATNTRPFGEDQLPIMKQLINAAEKDAYAGVLLWHWSDANASSFAFSPIEDARRNYTLMDLEQLLR